MFQGWRDGLQNRLRRVRFLATVAMLVALSGCCKMMHTPVGMVPECLIPDLEEPGCAEDAHVENGKCVAD